MAKVQKISEHDWMAVRVTFPDGTKANVTWNRGGENVTVTPSSALADTLSHIVRENKARLGKPGYPFPNLGPVSDAMEQVGLRARTLAEYVEGLKTALQVTGTPPQPSAAAPARTVVTLRQSRGWVLNALFPSGERVELKISGKSVGMRMAPEVASAMNDTMGICMGIKQAGLMGDDALAEMARETAADAGGVREWIESMRAAMAPKPPGPGR